MGGAHGMCQVVEKFFHIQKASENKFVKFIRIVVTFLIVNFAWTIFRSPDLYTAYRFFKQIFTGYKGFSIDVIGFDTLIYMVVGVIVLALYEILAEYYPGTVGIVLDKKYLSFVIYLALAFLILATGVLDGSNFIYVIF